MLTVPTRTQRRPLRISTDTSYLHSRTQSTPDSVSSSSTNASATTSGTTPSIADSDWFICRVVCMHDFESPDPDLLSFSEGEVLFVIKQEESGWWAAMRPQGDVGWIPSSFVEPQMDQVANKMSLVGDTGKIQAPREEIIQNFGGVRESEASPHSATHDAWVPMSEDFKVPSLQLVTPTDLVSQWDFEDVARKFSYESFFSISDDERSPLDANDLRMPASPLSCIPQPPTPRDQASRLTPKPVQSAVRKSEPFPTQTESGSLRQPRRCGVLVDDQTSLLHLSTWLDRDHSFGLNMVDSPRVMESFSPLKWTSSSQTYRVRNLHDSGDRPKGLPASPRPGFHLSRSESDVRSPALHDNNLTTRNPDDIAEQLSVLAHGLYAVIRPQECLTWLKARTGPDVANLHRFLDVHDHIAAWVQKSVVTYGNLGRRADTLDFWISVAEKCRSLRNFDTFCAIMTGLSSVALSILRYTWARCNRKQNYDTLANTYDSSNGFRTLIAIMGTANGPCVPFVRVHLNNLTGIEREYSDETLPCSLGEAAIGLPIKQRMIHDALSAMLRHQSPPYTFRVSKPTRKFVDEQLRAAGSTTSTWIKARSRDVQLAELDFGA